jgi:hypothetical protein
MGSSRATAVQQLGGTGTHWLPLATVAIATVRSDQKRSSGCSLSAEDATRQLFIYAVVEATIPETVVNRVRSDIHSIDLLVTLG